MAEKNFFKLLEASFPESDKETWKKTAIKELNGDDPFLNLRWTDKDQLEFSPYYDHDDLTKLPVYDKFNLTPAGSSFLGNRSWLNMPLVTVINELTANRSALQHLQNGADAILFDVSDAMSRNVDKLLNEIQLEYCAIAFKGVDAAFATQLAAYVSKLQVGKSKIQCQVFWDEVPQAVLADQFSSLGYYVPASTSIREIHDALVFACRILDATENRVSTFNKLCFSLNTDTAFLNQIAKIKALRRLWYQLACIYGVNDYDPASLHIHVRSEAWTEKNFQPHANLLKATTAAMSAIIGGCDALTVFAEDELNTTMSRIARNVSSVLREESYFDKVSDPLAGSYAIEAMTDELARKAWEMFQNTMTTK